jgi:hypothetical protein
MKRWILVVYLLTLALLVGCKDALVGTDPSDNPVSNFDEFWTRMDQMYSFFEYKDLDWDSVYTVHRPTIHDQTSNAELLEVFAEMVQTLRDGHVNIFAGTQTLSYTGWYDQVPANFDMEDLSGYLQHRKQLDNFLYGDISDEIGYIYIESFSGSIDFSSFDTVMRLMSNKQALIIDIRNNGGGSDLNSDHVASYFHDTTRVYGYVRWRNGPDHDDFTDWRAKKIKPGESRFLGQAVVLTNRRVFSSAENFVLAMRYSPQVTIMGDTTGGGSGNPIYQELPNGWTYRLSRWQQVDRNYRFYEQRGLIPDEVVWINSQHAQQDRDTILEQAIDKLSGS